MRNRCLIAFLLLSINTVFAASYEVNVLTLSTLSVPNNVQSTQIVNGNTLNVTISHLDMLNDLMESLNVTAKQNSNSDTLKTDIKEH